MFNIDKFKLSNYNINMELKYLPVLVFALFVISTTTSSAANNTEDQTETEPKTNATSEVKTITATEESVTAEESDMVPAELNNKPANRKTGMQEIKEEKIGTKAAKELADPQPGEQGSASFRNMIKEKLKIREQEKPQSERFSNYRNMTQQNYNLIKEKFMVIKNLKCENKDTELFMKRLVLKEAKLSKAIEHQYFILSVVEKRIESLSSGFGGSEYEEEIKEIETNLESVEYNLDSYSTLFNTMAEETGCNGDLPAEIQSQVSVSNEYLKDSVSILMANKENLINLLRSVK